MHCDQINEVGYNNQFITCVRRLTHVVAIGWTSVRPSVRPSVANAIQCLQTKQQRKYKFYFIYIILYFYYIFILLFYLC